MDDYLPSPLLPDLHGTRNDRRDAQYRHLVEVATGVERWIRETQHPPPSSEIFWNRELELRAPVTVDNRVKVQTPLSGVVNAHSGISVFRHEISEVYGYLNFIGSYEKGVYTYSRLVWYHWKYWDPME